MSQRLGARLGTLLGVGRPSWELSGPIWSTFWSPTRSPTFVNKQRVFRSDLGPQNEFQNGVPKWHQNGLLATTCASRGPNMLQLHLCDFACSQLGSPGASLESSWGLLGRFLVHVWGIWGPSGDVFWPLQGHFWGLLRLCLWPFNSTHSGLNFRIFLYLR